MNRSADKADRIWNRYFVLACLNCLFIGFSMNMMNSTMAKYIYSLYGNASFSGVLNAAFAVMAILGRLIAGRMSDRQGRRFVTFTGCVIFAVSIFCFGTFPYVAALILFRALQGFGYSVASTANYAAGADVLPPKRMGEGIGYLGLGYSLSTAVGPAIALALIAGGDYSPMFLITTLTCALAAVTAFVNNYEKKPEFQFARTIPAEQQAEERGIAKVIEKKALPATMIQIFHAMAFAAVNSFIVIYADSRGIAGTSLFFTFMAIAMCATRFFSGRLTDRFGEVAVALPCILCTIVGFILLIVTKSQIIFYAAGFLMGMSFGTVNPVLQAAAIKASPANRRGAASGTYQLSNDIANGVGAVVWGLTIDLFGYTVTFLGCIACAIIAIALLLVFFGKRSVKQN